MLVGVLMCRDMYTRTCTCTHNMYMHMYIISTTTNDADITSYFLLSHFPYVYAYMCICNIHGICMYMYTHVYNVIDRPYSLLLSRFVYSHSQPWNATQHHDSSWTWSFSLKVWAPHDINITTWHVYVRQVQCTCTCTSNYKPNGYMLTLEGCVQWAELVYLSLVLLPS